jgi:hypothetical protein
MNCIGLTIQDSGYMIQGEMAIKNKKGGFESAYRKPVEIKL